MAIFAGTTSSAVVPLGILDVGAVRVAIWDGPLGGRRGRGEEGDVSVFLCFSLIKRDVTWCNGYHAPWSLKQISHSRVSIQYLRLVTPTICESSDDVGDTGATSTTSYWCAGRKHQKLATAADQAGLPVDAPIPNNTLLNTAASQSVSLYQRCSALRACLLQISGFPFYFSLASPDDSRQSTDPVTLLWDLFSLGIPLCYIFDKLPDGAGFKKINHSEFVQEQYDANPDRAKKHAIECSCLDGRRHVYVRPVHLVERNLKRRRPLPLHRRPVFVLLLESS
ncbi:hypothetical protein C8J57DRAFT_1253530 [Mycena rebaudengoi]|nr:hypothetical protein C8J57DRAFT_1253530 [Mycena rebaudengoi]